MKLIISTPRFLLRHDTDVRRTTVLDSGRGEYYGISWDFSGTKFATTHSRTENDQLRTLTDYANSEVGLICISGKDSLPFLSAPHQIFWVDEEHLVATNTGRNTVICLNTSTQFTLHRRIGSALWDRISNDSFDGVHLNSIYYKESKVFVLANNFGKGSFVCEYVWPDFLLKARHPLPGLTGLHNLYIDDEKHWLVCDSNRGAISDARTGKCLWVNGGQGFTRGLAATHNLIFVGHSEKSGRALRTGTESGIWVIDRATWNTVDYIFLGHFGCVNEIRIADEPDLAHHGRPLQEAALDFLSQKPSHIAGARLEHARRFDIIIGAIKLDLEAIAPHNGGFLLCMNRTSGFTASSVSAKICFAESDGVSNSHAALIARYHGPEDQNMIAAIFQMDDQGYISVGLWTHFGGEWRQHSGVRISDDNLTVDCGQRSLHATLLDKGNIISLQLRGETLLSLSKVDTNLPPPGGRFGFRMHGSHIRVSEISPERREPGSLSVG